MSVEAAWRSLNIGSAVVAVVLLAGGMLGAVDARISIGGLFALYLFWKVIALHGQHTTEEQRGRQEVGDGPT